MITNWSPAGRHRAPAGPGCTDLDDGRTGRHRAGAPAPHDDSGPAIPAEDMVIVGITAAARYLGYDKPESFRRARTRHPIPDERKLPDGRPYWTTAALRSWQANERSPETGSTAKTPARRGGPVPVPGHNDAPARLAEHTGASFPPVVPDLARIRATGSLVIR